MITDNMKFLANIDIPMVFAGTLVLLVGIFIILLGIFCSSS